MRPVTRRLAIAFTAITAAGLLAACGQGAGGGAATAEDMTMGEADAPVTVIEYASVTCSHCANFAETVFPAFKAKYIDTGQVKYVFREFLTPPNELAAAGFLIARCAGKEKYFGVIDALFHSQAEMFQSDARAVLFRIGQSAGMTDAQITSCISSEEELAALQKRVQTAIDDAKIQATPTFVINGETMQGEQTMAQFDAAIQPLLKK
jgi:protein-disulfide isomerase